MLVGALRVSVPPVKSTSRTEPHGVLLEFYHWDNHISWDIYSWMFTQERWSIHLVLAQLSVMTTNKCSYMKDSQLCSIIAFNPITLLYRYSSQLYTIILRYYLNYFTLILI
jgi:hypothetical protein